MKEIEVTFFVSSRKVLPRVKFNKTFKGALPTFALSRDGAKCFFRLDVFEGHDDHAPAFDTARQMQSYINRLARRIKAWAKSVSPTDFE